MENHCIIPHRDSLMISGNRLSKEGGRKDQIRTMKLECINLLDHKAQKKQTVEKMEQNLLNDASSIFFGSKALITKIK